MNNHAFTFKYQGKDAAAVQLIRECFELRKQILGIKHPNTPSSYEAA
jgi:hypothetical protein